MNKYGDLTDSCSQPSEPFTGESGWHAGKPGPGWWFTPILVILLIGSAGAAILRNGIPTPDMATTRPARADTQVAPTMVRSGLPRNHPTVQAVISDPRSFLAKAEKTAAAHPGDLNAWDLFGDVALQASAFDLSYYDKAEKAYGHALAIDPNDPRALKGMGNINYDRHRYDAASSFYERYLRPRPNDARVLTDLGTLHLAKQNIDEALRLYDRALALEPDLFAARFNIAVAHLLRGDKARAVENLIQAHKIAPDASAKLKIEVMLARLEGHTYASTAVTPTDDNPPMTFRDAVERVVRTLPSEGSKVRSLEWPSQYKAIVLVSDFAGAMPAAEKARLLHNLKAGIITAKVAHKVSDAVEIDLRDAATGRTVATVID